jgi:hypothetical protein
MNRSESEELWREGFNELVKMLSVELRDLSQPLGTSIIAQLEEY